MTESEIINNDSVQSVFDQIMKEHEIKLGKLAQPVRVALTGSSVSPGIFDVIHVLGRERTLKRLQDAINRIKERGQKG